MSLRLRLAHLFRGLAILAFVVAAVLLIPLEPGTVVIPARNAAVCLVSVIVIGKLLYDTLFYDRYQP